MKSGLWVIQGHWKRHHVLLTLHGNYNCMNVTDGRTDLLTDTHNDIGRTK